ncbi:MAG: sporulation protein YabP [Clostridia bacterium]|nr:sporulation protein YabP [Clostridia bacterium]
MEQNVCLFSRKRMELTGIEEVESFSEEQITLRTELGMIAVDGHGLKIEHFSTENGELAIVGEFDSFYYYGKREPGEKRGLFGKIFK